MKKNLSRFIVMLLLLATLFGLSAFGGSESAAPARGRVVVANRASGSISIIDARSNALIETIPLPPGANTPEPMYVVYTPAKNRVFVGDRANDRVVAFNARTFAVEGTVQAGEGVFHMWADPQSKQLWVNNDIDTTTTVINPKTLEVLATVPTPADLVAMGGKPHDVILDPQGEFAFVSILGIAGPNDYVVKFSTRTFDEVGRAPVGKDPHLSLTRRNNNLYVPSQNSNEVGVLNRRTLAQVASIPVPGAHGAGMPRNGRVFYTTNLPGGGADGLFAIDTRTNTVIGSVDTPYAVPHNIALDTSGRKLFVTHSGATADKVTIYTVNGNNAVPSLDGEVTVGLNPFGLAFVP
jgi:DNA-binding beta-propeller fold protein YncE